MSAYTQPPLSARQVQMLRDLSHGLGFDFLDPADYHASGSLWFSNRERVIDSLRRQGLIDGEQLTDAGKSAMSRCNGGAA